MYKLSAMASLFTDHVTLKTTFVREKQNNKNDYNITKKYNIFQDMPLLIKYDCNRMNNLKVVSN